MSTHEVVAKKDNWLKLIVANSADEVELDFEVVMNLYVHSYSKFISIINKICQESWYLRYISYYNVAFI